MALLEVENLEIAVSTQRTLLPVVQGVSFTVDENETLGIVGESGCGKSLTSLAIMGLLGTSPVRITGGSIHFDGMNLLALSEREWRAIMGNRMAMIFQEPMTSLNPVYRIGDQIVENLRQHQNLSHAAARDRSVELLSLVRIPDPSERIDSFPHQMSGGQRQRVMIAMALSCDPKLLIADEPTTALDVTVQKEILELLGTLKLKKSLSILFITHNLNIVRKLADRIYVMKDGRIIEEGKTKKMFDRPKELYTEALLNSKINFKLASISSKKVLLEIKNLSVKYPGKGGLFMRKAEDFKALKEELQAPLSKIECWSATAFDGDTALL